MAKGFTGAKTNYNNTPVPVDIPQGSSSGFSEGSTAHPIRYGNWNSTRDGTCHLMFTWNSREVQNFSHIVSVRMYITSTPPNQIALNSNWAMGDANPYSDSIVTLLNQDITAYATDGDLYETWVNGTTYSGCYVFFSIQYYIGSQGWIARAEMPALHNNNIGVAPSIAYNQLRNEITVGESVAGRRIVEFRRTDIPYGYPTAISDETTLNEMMLVSLINVEGYLPQSYKGYYYLTNNNSLERWSPGYYTIGVDFRSSTNQTQISNAIDNAINNINSVLNVYGVYFTRSGTTGNINVIVDSEWNLFGIDLSNAPYIYGGTWETNVSNGVIYGATVRLANDFYAAFPYNTYETVAVEELAQTMGAGHDQNDYLTGTVHCDFNHHNRPQYLTTRDQNILRLVYSSAVNPKDTYYTVASKLNLPKGCYLVSTNTTDISRTFTASFLESGATYQIRAFIVNVDGYVTTTSDWLTIYTLPKSLHIDTPSGWVIPEVWIDTPTGWVKSEVWIDTPSGWVKTTS